jgi:hypothetical protein
LSGWGGNAPHALAPGAADGGTTNNASRCFTPVSIRRERFTSGSRPCHDSWMRSLMVLVGVALLAPGCGGIGVEPPPSADAGSIPGQATTADAGAPAEPLTTCCQLDNERAERLDYKCSTGLNVPWFEGRGYRCWLVQ